MNYSFLSRIRVISAFIFLFALLLITKLFFVQVIHGAAYNEKADRQYSTPSDNIFERGSIYFTGKTGQQISAAATISGFKIAINPKLIADAGDTFDKLSAVTKLDKDSFLASAAKKDDPYEEVANKLSRAQADQVSALKLPGVSVYKENWRFYPGDELAAPTVGFVGFKGDDYSGRTGLEEYYDSTLSRKNNQLYVNFFAEVFSDINRTLFNGGDQEGDVVTTIEPTIQSSLEKELAGVMKDWSSQQVGGIIIDPKDGTIYAMASLPSYDANNYSKVKDISLLGNPLVENVYEFGSVVKAITMAIGLDSGAITQNTTYDDKGSITLDGRKINNYDFKARGVIPMQQILNQSLNVGAVFVEQKTGMEKFRNYMLSYGIGDKTGIDLPAEASGLVGNLHSPREVEYATASFGQGIAMTAVEAARAFSVLANGGYLITPHIASEIDYTQGGSKKIEYPAGAQIIRKDTSDQITQMLVTVVDKALLKGTVKMDHYSIAAKTGTAQMSDPAGGYYADRYLHSFMGYFPAYNPKFLIFLFNVYPKNVEYASETLTRPFIDMAKFLIDYYNVAPDR
jgi:cell division protein FtsI/penicillin-binding protein 2